MGYASNMIVMLVLSGIIMILLGIIGEYLGKIFLIMVRLRIIRSGMKFSTSIVRNMKIMFIKINK